MLAHVPAARLPRPLRSNCDSDEIGQINMSIFLELAGGTELVASSRTAIFATTAHDAALPYAPMPEVSTDDHIEAGDLAGAKSLRASRSGDLVPSSASPQRRMKMLVGSIAFNSNVCRPASVPPRAARRNGRRQTGSSGGSFSAIETQRSTSSSRANSWPAPPVPLIPRAGT